MFRLLLKQSFNRKKKTLLLSSSLSIIQQNQRQQKELLRKSNRTLHFASTQYASCFDNLPTIQNDDIEFIRQCTIDYIKNHFDSQLWYNEPVSSFSS